MKIVINKCYGGFSISHKAVMRYAELKGIKIITKDDDEIGLFTHYYLDEVKEDNFFSIYSLERTDPVLIQVVEELGSEADGECAKLKIVEIPDQIDWYINEYDGLESIHQNHASWG